MSRKQWMQTLIAAAVILVAAGFVAFAETVDVDVDSDHGGKATVKVVTDGSTEVFNVDDLADGEEKVVTSGEHTFTIRRDGDDISVSMDGKAIDAGALGKGHGIRKMVIVGDGDEGGKMEKKIIVKAGDGDGCCDGDHVKVVKILGGAADEDIVWKTNGDLTFDIDDLADLGDLKDLEGLKTMVVKGMGDHAMMFMGDCGDREGHGKVALSGSACGKGRVVYRCPDTGSVLVVDEKYATSDTMTDPASGCTMQRVDDAKAKVVTITKTITVSDDDDDKGNDD